MNVEAWIILDVEASASFSAVFARWDESCELDIDNTDNTGLGTDQADVCFAP